MQLPLWLLLAFLSTTQGFKMPTLEDIGNVFSNLVMSESREEVIEPVRDVDDEAERVKRQSFSSDETNYIASIPQLPTIGNNVLNERYMPVLANGHIGVTAFTDTLYLNGLYSGKGGKSHRAKIPALNMANITLGASEQEFRTQRSYKFNARTGVFEEKIESELATVYHRVYAHSKYIRVLVSDIRAERKRGGVFYVSYPELKSPDIEFGEKQVHDYSYWRITGKVKDSERSETPETVAMYWMEPLTQVALNSKDSWHEVSIVAIDKLESSAQSDFGMALDVLLRNGGTGQEALYNEHVETWERIQAQGRVELVGAETTLARAVEFSQYYLLSSLSPVFPATAPLDTEPLYGAGRGSLGKGGEGKDYQGHVFWDSEMYIMPAVLLFHPELAKKMLRYRSFQAQAAELNAKASGDKGYRFPWESAYSGYDVTPDGTCDGCAQRQIHVTAAVGWAFRQYFSATRDRDFIRDPYYNSCDMTREIARFFVNRAKYNTSSGRYDINDVMGPDDWHDHVNNNAYTNAAASLAIHWARYYACICERSERGEVPDEWIQTALYLKLPYSNVKRMHHQYEGFSEKNANITNKQADTIMMVYPLNWNVSTDIMKNDLERYEQVTDKNSPAMTWSWFTIGFKHVNDDQKVFSYFTKSYQNYIAQPFNIWTEYETQESGGSKESEGAVNYLPGMGAFLQSIIYGFAGVRVRPETLEFHNPQPPPQSSRVILRNLTYLGSYMTIEITKTEALIDVHAINPTYPLLLRYNDTASGREETLNTGPIVKISNVKDGFYIFSTRLRLCDHPRDYIFMPWGYSPWISGSSNILPSVLLLLCTIAMTLIV